MDKTQIIFLLAIALVLYIAPVVSALIDLRVGIRKARERGEDIDSDRLKDTPKKISSYLLTIFSLSIVDVVQMALVHYLHTYYAWGIPLLPLLTAIGSVGCCCIEVKSIMESQDAKTRRDAREVAKLAAAIVKAHGDVGAVADVIEQQLIEQDHEHD